MFSIAKFFVLVILQIVLSSGITQPDNGRKMFTKSRAANLISGLTDAELESALSDLSLGDLKILNRYIEESKNNDDHDYVEKNFLHSDDDSDDINASMSYDELSYDDRPRNKRGFVLREPEIHVDEEYIKELINSFPRDQDQNNQDEDDDKRDHIRVKRL